MDFVKSLKKYAERRAKELKVLGTTSVTAEAAEVGVAGNKLTFRLGVERIAAWKLYVELNTRIATQVLRDSEGTLREAMSSLHKLFEVTRQILKEAGPAVGIERESLGFYAMEILNQVLRPFLSKWHPEYLAWEERRDPNMSTVEHERTWPRVSAFRRELESVAIKLRIYSDALAKIAGIST